MNFLISLVLLVGLQGITHADEVTQEDKEAVCNSINEFAGTAMSARQNGVTLAQSMSALENQEDAEIKKVLRLITMSAYEAPAYQSDEHKNKEISEFQNQWYMVCLKEIS